MPGQEEMVCHVVWFRGGVSQDSFPHEGPIIQRSLFLLKLPPLQLLLQPPIHFSLVVFIKIAFKYFAPPHEQYRE